MACKGTFSQNKDKPFYSWYKYNEAFSMEFVRDEINNLNYTPSLIYDPFGGCGTTMLFSSLNNIDSIYSEINPFMSWVTNTKINSVIEATKDIANFKKLVNDVISSLSIQQLELFEKKQNLEKQLNKYFDNDVYINCLMIKEKINEKIKNSKLKDLFLLALATNLIDVSNTVKRGDLRYATDKELKQKDKDIIKLFIKSIKQFTSDIELYGKDLKKPTTKVSDDARTLSNPNEVDLVVTSPPYLNGTNYIRNTKIELEFLEFIRGEFELPLFHSKGIVAGINNVTRKNANINHRFDFVDSVLKEIEPVVYDDRIIPMIERYFDNMFDVFVKLRYCMKNDSVLILDIGDSQFCGVHIPTHEFLIKIAEMNDFKLYDEEVLRERISKNGMRLTQRILRFKLNKESLDDKNYKNSAISFCSNFPYKNEPFNKKSWGNKLHSLCSYQGKLKPAIAHFLVTYFTETGETVLDPLCGVGTIPLEACLNGRIGIGNDLSALASTVTKAKVNIPQQDNAWKEIENLKLYIESNIKKYDNKEIPYTNFGLNKTLKDYFHIDTLKEIVLAREYCLSQDKTPELCFVMSCIMHILHGNRPYALSRTSHPLTPYAPKGDYIYKSLIDHLIDKATSAYKELNIDGYIQGISYNLDYKELKNYINNIDWIITSPPFADSFKFYTNNWMRLWFSGWVDDDFVKAKELYLDGQQEKDLSVYKEFFNVCYSILKPKGKMILHLGKTKKIDMAKELSGLCQHHFKIIYIGEENVSDIEKHGIRDKNSTFVHQFMFLEKIN